MNWLLWILAIVSLGVPVGSLTLDRAMGIPARTQWKYWGTLSLVAFLVALIGAISSANGLVALILWGVLSGVLATLALDIVRLIGHHVFHAFPLDMPQMFGTLAYGLAPQLQHNLVVQMVKHLAEIPEEQRRMMMGVRLKAIVNLDEPLRFAVVGAMQRGLSQLREEKRQAVLATQMALMADLESSQRQKIMKAMDAAMAGKADPVYAQPRGLPKAPMQTIRRFFEKALPQTWDEAGLAHSKPILAGYIWHFIIGTTFAITYNLVFGQGAWTLAFAWGAFVWLSMMVSMPPMMPLVKFPWWFPIMPLIAHLAMAIPIGYIALNFLDETANAASLLGALGFLP